MRQDELSTQLTKLTSTYNNSLKENENLRTELANKSQALSSMSSELETLRARLEEMEVTMAHVRAENNDLQSKLASHSESQKAEISNAPTTKTESLSTLLDEKTGGMGPTVRGSGAGRRASAPPASLSAAMLESPASVASTPSTGNAVAAVAARARNSTIEPPICGSVTSWTRINNGDVVFVVLVRITNAKWNVIKTFNDFKLLRMRLLVTLGTRGCNGLCLKL
jgi:septal ring factor EnvC (AmiA/AmiB activator)